MKMVKEIYGGKGRLWVKWLLAESKLWWQGGVNDAVSILLYWEKYKQNDAQCCVELKGAEW